MSDMTRITERCACGATFNWMAQSGPAEGKEAAAAFRKGHQHARLVGRCLAAAPMLTTENAGPLCSLDHGHSGAHHDDMSGANWTTPAPDTTPPSEDESNEGAA